MDSVADNVEVLGTRPRPLTRRPLGRTELVCSPLGLGGGGSVSREDALYAADRGINYFFHSSDLHHFAYQGLAAALKELCRSGSARRSEIILATVSYVNDPAKLIAVLYDQLSELRTDYIDVFHFGWITDETECETLFSTREDLTSRSPLTKAVGALTQRRAEESRLGEELLRKGYVRHVGASFHSRAMARRHADVLDVLMLRYNIAHTGIETDVLPALDDETRPGVVAFNVAHEGLRLFSQRPAQYPANWPVPSISDCYRFALAHPKVDLVLTGLRNRQEIDAALGGLERGHLSPDELTFLRKYGDFIKKRDTPHLPR